MSPDTTYSPCTHLDTGNHCTCIAQYISAIKYHVLFEFMVTGLTFKSCYFSSYIVLAKNIKVIKYQILAFDLIQN